MKHGLISLAVISLLGCFVLTPNLVYGQAGRESLPQVEVTNTFANPPLTLEEKAEPTSRQVFDEVQLQNSSAEVLSDFLAEMGIGVYKTPTDQGHTLLTMRGFRTDHLSKELDGRIMFLVNGHRTGTGNATQIPLVNVERIEILRGPEMLRYTAAAPGGVINVITKKGGPDKIAGSVEFGMGSFDLYKSQVKLNGAVNGFDYSVGYAYLEKGDYEDGDGYQVKHTGVKRNQSFMGELGYTFNTRHRISWSTYYYQVDGAEKPAYIDPEDPLDLTYANGSVGDRYNLSNTLAYKGGTEDDRWEWEVSYTFGKTINEIWSINKDLGTPMASSFDRKLLQTSLTYNGDMFTLTGGFDYLDYVDGEGTPGSYNVATNVFTQGKKRIETGTYKNYAAYLLGNVRFLNDSLIFTGALRYDKYEVEDKRIDPGDYIPPVNPNVYGHARWPKSLSYSHLSPAFGVSYLPLDWLKLRANWTHSFRPPSPRESISGWYEAYGFWGYPWNKAEESDIYEFGFDIVKEHYKFAATYFWSYTKDYIYQHQDPVQDRQRVRNAERQKRNGVELQASANVAGLLGYDSFELRPYFNFSHIFNSKELYRHGIAGNWGRYTNNYGTQIPKTTIGAGIRFRYPKEQLSVNLNATYWGKVYPSQSMMNPAAYDPNLRYPGFTVVDLAIRKVLVDFSQYGNIEVKLDINNIFDRLYAFGDPRINRNSATNFYMPGRSFYAAVAYHF